MEAVVEHGRRGAENSQILPVIVSNGVDRKIRTYGFVDNGSELMLMSQKLADTLGLNGRVERLRLKWSNAMIRVEVNS